MTSPAMMLGFNPLLGDPISTPSPLFLPYPQYPRLALQEGASAKDSRCGLAQMQHVLRAAASPGRASTSGRLSSEPLFRTPPSSPASSWTQGSGRNEAAALRTGRSTSSPSSASSASQPPSPPSVVPRGPGTFSPEIAAGARGSGGSQLQDGSGHSTIPWPSCSPTSACCHQQSQLSNQAGHCRSDSSRSRKGCRSHCAGFTLLEGQLRCKQVCSDTDSRNGDVSDDEKLQEEVEHKYKVKNNVQSLRHLKKDQDEKARSADSADSEDEIVDVIGDDEEDEESDSEMVDVMSVDGTPCDAKKSPCNVASSDDVTTKLEENYDITADADRSSDDASRQNSPSSRTNFSIAAILKPDFRPARKVEMERLPRLPDCQPYTLQRHSLHRTSAQDNPAHGGLGHRSGAVKGSFVLQQHARYLSFHQRQLLYLQQQFQEYHLHHHHQQQHQQQQQQQQQQQFLLQRQSHSTSPVDLSTRGKPLDDGPGLQDQNGYLCPQQHHTRYPRPEDLKGGASAVPTLAPLLDLAKRNNVMLPGMAGGSPSNGCQRYGLSASKKTSHGSLVTKRNSHSSKKDDVKVVEGTSVLCCAADNKVPSVSTSSGSKGSSIISSSDCNKNRPLRGPTSRPTTATLPGADNKNLLPAWVFCTRYSDRPSSGPRTRKVKRKTPGKASVAAPSPSLSSPSSSSSEAEKRPRTAFTSDQLSRLKREFDECRYLTEGRRRHLAVELGLTESQIKIWFQNKRAKIKKSSGVKNELALQLMAQGLYNHATVPVVVEEDVEGEDDVDDADDLKS